MTLWSSVFSLIEFQFSKKINFLPNFIDDIFFKKRVPFLGVMRDIQTH